MADVKPAAELASPEQVSGDSIAVWVESSGTALNQRIMQAAFVAEDVTSIIKESIDAVLQNQQYNHFKVQQTLSVYILFCLPTRLAVCRLVSGHQLVLKLASSVWLT